MLTSVTRARVEAQLVPPPSKQRKLSASGPVNLGPGTTFVVATSLPGAASGPGIALGQRLAVGQPVAVRAVRPPVAGGQPLTGAIRLRLPASAVPVSGGQVIIQRSALPAPVLQQLVSASGQPQVPPQAIVVRANNTLSSVSGLVRASPTLMLSSQPTPASVSLTASQPSSSQYIVHSGAPLSPGVARLSSPLAQAQPLTNNISNSVNISGLAAAAHNTSTTFLSSLSSVTPAVAAASAPQQQFIIRYLPRAPQPGPPQAPIFLQPLGPPDKLSPLQSPLQVSPAPPQLVTKSPGIQIVRTPPPTPPPGSPQSTKTFNPTMIIQAITKPCTPPPSSPSPIQSSPPIPQRMVFRAAKPVQRIVIPNQAKNNFTKPLPPIQTNIKTVRTTLVPRSPVSDDQISNILQTMVPEPQAVCKINQEEKEKASAVAALAANNFDEGKLSPTKTLSPGLPTSPLLPLVQPLQIQENGANGSCVEETSLDSVIIPEISESLHNLDKKPLEVSKNQIVLKVCV